MITQVPTLVVEEEVPQVPTLVEEHNLTATTPDLINIEVKRFRLCRFFSTINLRQGRFQYNYSMNGAIQLFYNQYPESNGMIMIRYLSEFATQYLACLSVVTTKKHLRGELFANSRLLSCTNSSDNAPYCRRSSCTMISKNDHCRLRLLRSHTSYHPAFSPHDYVSVGTFDSGVVSEQVDWKLLFWFA